MKKYFVTSDIHSFYTIFHNALLDAGWEQDNPNHILIICGDVFDRGNEAKELLDYLLSIPEERLILIRGNHEDLLDACIDEIELDKSVNEVHYYNGTLGTIEQLVGKDILLYQPEQVKAALKDYYKLINRCKDYYELGDYVFVHGWVPNLVCDSHGLLVTNKYGWEKARWKNGMQEWSLGSHIEGKTVVCGHWHTSFGNYNYHNIGSGEFEKDSSFEPFIDKGIIALDACTAYSHKVNVVTITV